MTNTLLRLFNLETNNKQIIEENAIFEQNLQGALEKEQKFKAELQNRNNGNNHVLVELQANKQKINKMKRQNKDLENMKIKRDSLHVILKETNANY
jgi:hypothetical protein